jgi:uncharacterized delta-60 repeat protein
MRGLTLRDPGFLGALLRKLIMLDPAFDTGIGFDYLPSSIALQADGKIVVGGTFTTYNGTGIGYGIARLNSDGSLDTSFVTGSGFNNSVFSIALQADGKILLVGSFNAYNGVTQNRIARLNSDGSLDTGFNTGSGFSSGVYSIALQADGKIVVGGGFTSYNGTSTGYGIARLNSDGSLDTSFNTGSGFSSEVNSIALQADGKIVVSGFFTAYNGVTQNYMTRLNSDGSLDTGFNTGTGFNNFVLSIALQADGKILVGSGFTSYNGVTQNYMTRLNSDGTLDTSFNIGTGFNNFVFSTAIQSDGKILAGGIFTAYNGVTQNYMTRLNSDGTRDTSFVTRFNTGPSSIAIQSDGKILVVGFFDQYNGTSIGAGIARLLPEII